MYFCLKNLISHHKYDFSNFMCFWNLPKLAYRKMNTCLICTKVLRRFSLCIFCVCRQGPYLRLMRWCSRAVAIRSSSFRSKTSRLGGLALCPMLPGWFFFWDLWSSSRLEQERSSGELPKRSGPPVDQHIMQLTKSCLHIAFLHSRPGSNVICETLERRCRTLL